MDNLLFLFPDRRHTEHILMRAAEVAKKRPAHGNLSNLTMYELTKIGERLDCYRDAGFKVYHAMYADSVQSDVFVPRPGDMIVQAGSKTVEYSGQKTTVPDFEGLVKDVKPGVIGGFYSGDCVKSAMGAARKLDNACIVDWDITDRHLTALRLWREMRIEEMFTPED